MNQRLIFILLLCIFFLSARAENGYDLWLRYHRIEDTKLLGEYRQRTARLLIQGNSPTIIAATKELTTALGAMLDRKPSGISISAGSGSLIIGAFNAPIIAGMKLKGTDGLGKEGFIIRTMPFEGKKATVIAANSDLGVLYGVFGFLKLLQTGKNIENLSIIDRPKIQLRVLNHWDNLNGTVERGYAGSSLWDWQRLPGYLDKRYTDYARANASVGINGTVLNNVNASAKSLTKEYLVKAAALADVFRPYGIKVYLTARFSAPIEIGGLKTADPLDPAVKKWWAAKVDEIYSYIPDFGGFLVKANSEGQPGPQDYKRSHADGANVMADALAPHHGVVMWRAFVYENRKGEDRTMQAYQEFKKLDGDFRGNVLLQPKNGPIDFQPREPFHPLFGAMPKTPLMLEFQITQEYLGFATHLVYLAPLFRETLSSDTYSLGKGSLVGRVVDGSLEGHSISGIAGVANIGSDINWTGHLFGQSNWYAFGRMAWNPDLDPSSIADDWIRMTFSRNPKFIAPVKKMMLSSRENAVKYMMPLGLNHIMNLGTHYGPGPWDKITGWNAWDYHQADSVGLGVNRSRSGSNAVSQYFPQVSLNFNDPKTCPENLLLWFHHVPWKYKMSSGKTLWDELVSEYNTGAAGVKNMQDTWTSLKDYIDDERYDQVSQLLAEQYREAVWWRDGSVLYFQNFSRLPLPEGFEKPAFDLEHYRTLRFPDRSVD